MPKLDRDTVRKREQFVEELVFETPKISLADLNDKLKEKHKHRMRTDRLGELRDAARLKVERRKTAPVAPVVRAKRRTAEV
jgi:hypothetical protein